MDVSTTIGLLGAMPSAMQGFTPPTLNLFAQPGQLYINRSTQPYQVYIFTGQGWALVGTADASGNVTITGNLTVTGNETVGGTLGVTGALTAGSVTSGGDITLSAVATKINMNGGAVTDFIGTATLAAGTVTIANTNIAAADVVLVTRQGINGSTALGVFDVAITPATSFSITARDPTDATTETNDISFVRYVIFRQT